MQCIMHGDFIMRLPIRLTIDRRNVIVYHVLLQLFRYFDFLAAAS